MNPIPQDSMHFATFSAVKDITIPSCSRTSADPHLLETLLITQTIFIKVSNYIKSSMVVCPIVRDSYESSMVVCQIVRDSYESSMVVCQIVRD